MPGRYWRLRLADNAEGDFRQILRWTRKTFGTHQAGIYRELIKQAIAAVGDDPYLNGSRARDEIQLGIRTFHIGERGRHLLLYRILNEDLIEIGRILHDSMELKDHLPGP